MAYTAGQSPWAMDRTRNAVVANEHLPGSNDSHRCRRRRQRIESGEYSQAMRHVTSDHHGEAQLPGLENHGR